MWKPYGTVYPELVENTKMGTVRSSNRYSAAPALLSLWRGK